MHGLGASTKFQTSRTDRQAAAGTFAAFDWNVFARDDLVLETIESLLSGPGVLITGRPGSGKKALVTATLRRLYVKAMVIDLGFPEGNGATLKFSRLLDTIEEEDAAARVMSLGKAHTLLARESMGLPIVFFVPEDLQLGAHAVAMLASLAMADRISLLCTGTMSASAELRIRDDLAAAVHLHRIQLHPLDLESTRQVLANALGSGVSRRAAHQLWAASGGQMQMLRGLVQDWQGQGYLFTRGDVWVVSGDHGPIGARIRFLVSSVLNELTPPELEVVNLLALAQEIPLSTLMALCNVDAVDAVHSKGLVASSGKFSRYVRLQNEVHSKLAMELMSPGRAGALLKRFRNHSTLSPRMPALVELAWEQIAGLESSSSLVCAAAREALAQDETVLCLGILRDSGHSDTELELLHLEALQLAGLTEQAEAVLRALQRTLGPELPDLTWGQDATTILNHLRLDMAEILLTSMKPEVNWEWIGTLLERTRGKMGKWLEAECDSSPELMRIAGKLDLLEAQIFHRRGVPQPRRDLPYNHPWLSKHALLRWQIIHNKQSIRAGRIRLGLKRGSDLVMLLQQEKISTAASQRIKLELADMYLIAGEWKQAIYLLDAAWLGGAESPRLTETNGLYATLARLFDRDAITALEYARVEIEQLKVYDPLGHLPLAMATAALAAVRTQSIDVNLFLSELEALPTTPEWEIEQGVSIVVAIVKHGLGAVDEALDRLRQNASIGSARGAVNVELSNRLMLARFGDKAGLEELVSCARRADGSMADTALAFGIGNTNDADPAGNFVEAREPRRRTFHGVEVAPGRNLQRKPGNPSGHGGGEPLRDGSASDSDHVRGSALSLISSLTSRQHVIVAEAATGASSREISRRLHIKVRTVEGHLYQIYKFLNVGTRTELLRLFAQAQAETEARGTTLAPDT